MPLRLPPRPPRRRQEWLDIAGTADPHKASGWPPGTERFPVLFVDDLGGLEETYRVTVTLRDGSQHQPTGRARSRRGNWSSSATPPATNLNDFGLVDRRCRERRAGLKTHTARRPLVPGLCCPIPPHVDLQAASNSKSGSPAATIARRASRPAGTA
ncbi:MAG: hypothetical protein U0992_17395 [Planctomycetaceae bacterium]